MSQQVGVKEPFGNRIYKQISRSTALWLIACGTHRWALNQAGRMLERNPTPDPLREKPQFVQQPEPEGPRCSAPFERCYFQPPKHRRRARKLTDEEIVQAWPPQKPVSREVLASEELSTGSL